MSEFREQAAIEIGDLVGLPSKLIRNWMDSPNNAYLDPANKKTALLALEREARLRERAALREIKLHSSSKSSTHKIASAALDAGKEG